MITEAHESTVAEAAGKVNRFLAHFLESQVDLWQNYVDPREAYLGSDGELWEGIGGGLSPADEAPYRTCTELFQIQTIARILWRDNEFAKNGHKNRINYIIGSSHTYTVVGCDKSTPKPTIKRVQDCLDAILKVNHWKRRQREIKLRDDRDGETIIRKFPTDDGLMRFRFVEPRSLLPPSNASPHQSFGVETDPDDIETPVMYFIDQQPVSADQIQHRKWNVDASMKRGYPLMFPVRKNLTRAAKLLRNMSISTEIQTAIALIRKHEQKTQEAVRSFVNAKNAQADSIHRRPNETVMQYGSGSILDVPQGQSYEIPPQLDPSKTVAALQAELRAVASLLVVPEFMLTSDASNSNFASTMVAEGPAVKNFESEQESQIEYDTELLMDALQHAANSGLITQQELDSVKLNVTAPNVQVRNRLEEAQIRQIDMGLGILSPQTATGAINEDYEQEQTNIEQHQEKSGLPMLPPDPSMLA
jgi:hypothetical protein